MTPLERATRVLEDEIRRQCTTGEASLECVDDCDKYLMARAVLCAIRESSEAMVDAGEAVAVRPFVAAGRFTPETWQAMIDAALEEQP